MAVRKSLTDPLPGSLEQTAREVRALGVDALVAKLDLSRREDWPAAIDAALGRFERIDVLVNNGRYVGPGHMDPFEETPIELIEQMMLCNDRATPSDQALPAGDEPAGRRDRHQH